MDVSELLVQILSAVDYLHSRRMMHLDLKSDNMLVTGSNVVKIVDLGSAQLYTPGQAQNVEHLKELTECKGEGSDVTRHVRSGLKDAPSQVLSDFYPKVRFIAE